MPKPTEPTGGTGGTTGQYACQMCGTSFETQERLEEHNRTTHKQ